MPRLINRQKQIPNGFRFYLPALRWSSKPYQSFEQIVQGALGAIKANPHVAQMMGWPTDYNGVASMVDAFNAKLCQTNGWNDYITTDGGQSAAVPFPPPNRPGIVQSFKNVVAGSSTLIDWIKSGSEAVPPELSEKRAAVCVSCPMNNPSDLTSIFTVPVSNAIRAALNSRKEMNLSTSHDEKLGVCVACSCPIRLKIHLKLNAILSKMPKESYDALVPNCWIKTENNQT